MRGDGPAAFTQDGDESAVLSARPAFTGSFQTGSSVTDEKAGNTLSSLGFTINWIKSSRLPSQYVIYLGVELSSASMRARLSRQRVEAMTALLHRVTPHNVVTALSVMQLLGMMSAGHVVIPLGLLHMRRLQRGLIRLCIDLCISREAWFPFLPLWAQI